MFESIEKELVDIVKDEQSSKCFLLRHVKRNLRRKIKMIDDGNCVEKSFLFQIKETKSISLSLSLSLFFVSIHRYKSNHISHKRSNDTDEQQWRILFHF